MYNNIALQTEDIEPYKHHSAFWEEKVNDRAIEIEDELNEAHDEEKVPHHKTVDLAEEYDNIALQLSYNEHHSKFWNDRNDQIAAEVEKQPLEDDAPKAEPVQSLSQTKKEVNTDALGEVRHVNPSVDLEDEYSGLV